MMVSISSVTDTSSGETDAKPGVEGRRREQWPSRCWSNSAWGVLWGWELLGLPWQQHLGRTEGRVGPATTVFWAEVADGREAAVWGRTACLVKYAELSGKQAFAIQGRNRGWITDQSWGPESVQHPEKVYAFSSGCWKLSQDYKPGRAMSIWASGMITQTSDTWIEEART